MRDFPKRLATAEDIRNCKSLVDDGAFAAKDLLEAIEDLESMNSSLPGSCGRRG